MSDPATRNFLSTSLRNAAGRTWVSEVERLTEENAALRDALEATEAERRLLEAERDQCLWEIGRLRQQHDAHHGRERR